MVNENVPGLGDATATERWVNCEIQGCVNRVLYSPGRGAPPKYCGKTVDGLRHTRLTAYRLSRGQITLPARGDAGGASAESADPGQQRELYDGDARPVSTARMTLELVLAEMGGQILGHEQRMTALAGQITHALRTAADPAAATAEVAAAHRAARAEIDAAESERDRAILQARETARAAQDSDVRASAAETAAEEALAELESAQLARDQALAERDDLAVAMAQLREELDAAQARAETVHAEWDHTRERLEATAVELTAAQAQANRAAEHNEHLSTKLSTAREHLERWQTQAGEQRAELAALRSDLTAARTATDAEKAHGTQRLTDLHTRYDELVKELRTQIDQLREQVATQRTENDHGHSNRTQPRR